MVMVSGPAAAMGSSFTVHFPLAKVCTVWVCVPSVTVTCSPEPAAPHTGLTIFLCNTMELANGGFTATVACVEIQHIVTIKKTPMVLNKYTIKSPLL
jgi:hypothetical protein